MRRLFAAIAAVLAVAGAAHAASKTCRDEIGEERAEALQRQCIAVSFRTNARCNNRYPCAVIRAETARGCEFARQVPEGGEPPALCRQFPTH